MKLKCPYCGSDSLEMEIDARKLEAFHIMCENCESQLATVNRYSIQWVDDFKSLEDTD